MYFSMCVYCSTVVFAMSVQKLPCLCKCTPSEGKHLRAVRDVFFLPMGIVKCSGFYGAINSCETVVEHCSDILLLHGCLVNLLRALMFLPMWLMNFTVLSLLSHKALA